MFTHTARTTLATTALAAALAALAVGPSARAASLPISTCGQTVTTNAVLTKDLDCAGSAGIVVGASGIAAYGDGATLEGNRADGNGFPGGIPDGVGSGVAVQSFTIAPAGTNLSRGNDDAGECEPSSLC